MKQVIFLILALVLTVFAEEPDKNPWYVRIYGNKVFSSYQIEEQLDVPAKFGQMDTTKQDFIMRLSLENVKALYYTMGYFSSDIALEIQRDFINPNEFQRGYNIYIRDGERYRFSGVDVKAPEGIQVELDKSGLNTAQDRYYSHEEIAEDLQTIQNAFRAEGYLHAYVSSTEYIDTTHKKIRVEVNVETGPKVLMGGVISETHRTAGPGKKDSISEAGLTDTAWLSSLWRIKPGEVIDGNQYNSFKSKLFSTQLFTQIKLTDSLRADGLSDVHVKVTERIPGDTRYGFFYEQIYGFGAQAQARHKNFFGRFNEFSANVLVAQHKQEMSIGYANPLLFGTSFSIIPTAIRFDDRLTLNHEKIEQLAYSDRYEERYEIINRGDITFGITNHIRFRGTIDTRYVSKNKDTVFVVSKADSLDQDGNELTVKRDSLLEDKLLKLKGEIALTFDYTDDYFNPTKGIRVAPTIGAGTNWDGDLSSFNMRGNPYTYGEITANIYFPLFWTFNGALSGSVGKFFAKAIEDDARIFYQGGSRSVRGYRFRSIYAGYEEEENGDTLIYTGLTPRYLRFNEEIRWTLPLKSLRKWQIVQFYDWAYVTDHDPKYQDARDESFGFGLRYRWQFLTFRLDYAFKKTLDNWNAESFHWGRFAFDLSQTF